MNRILNGYFTPCRKTIKKVEINIVDRFDLSDNTYRIDFILYKSQSETFSPRFTITESDLIVLQKCLISINKNYTVKLDKPISNFVSTLKLWFEGKYLFISLFRGHFNNDFKIYYNKIDKFIDVISKTIEKNRKIKLKLLLCNNDIESYMK